MLLLSVWKPRKVSSGGVLPQFARILPVIASAVLANTLGKRLLNTLDSHMFDTSVEDKHVHVYIGQNSQNIALQKYICMTFANVKLKQMCERSCQRR